MLQILPCNTSLINGPSRRAYRKSGGMPAAASARGVERALARCLLSSLLDLLGRGAGADRDRPRPHALRQVPHQVDVEQPVLEVGALHLDVVGKLEAPLEAAGRDSRCR